MARFERADRDRPRFAELSGIAIGVAVSSPKVIATATAALAAAVLLRWLFDPVLGDTLPLVTLFGAVAIAVWAGGYRPAIVVAIAGYLICNYFFMAPRGHFGRSDAQFFVGLAAHAFTCSLII